MARSRAKTKPRARGAAGARPITPAPERAADRVFELEPHSERRRRQLLEVVSHIIETEGPDAVRMPRVAELAGCTRTLVYRYFEEREDLLRGVRARFYEQLGLSTTREEHARALRALADPDPARARERSRALFEATWDVLQELGIAGLVLTRAERLSAEELASQFPDFAEETEQRWMQPLRAVGLSAAAAQAALDCAASLTYRTFVEFRAGRLSRDAALELGFRGLRALVLALRDAGD
jgi:AcrR family transcriptional regulator